MNSDLKELLSLLKACNVQFLVIGAHALAVYARPRFTEDLDLWIKRSVENTHALHKALSEFGFAFDEGQVTRLNSGRNMLRLGAPPNQVDILNFLGAVGNEMDFETVHSRAVSAVIAGEPVLVLSKFDLIAAKRAAGRPQDLVDIATLESME